MINDHLLIDFSWSSGSPTSGMALVLGQKNPLKKQFFQGIFLHANGEVRQAGTGRRDQTRGRGGWAIKKNGQIHFANFLQIFVTTESEVYRQLQQHYNKNGAFQVSAPYSDQSDQKCPFPFSHPTIC